MTMNIPKTFEKVAGSAIFLALGTADYLKQVREHGDSYHQVMMARALKKPVILMLDRRLSPSERDELRECFDGLEILGTVFFDGARKESELEESAQKELGEILVKWKESLGK